MGIHNWVLCCYNRMKLGLLLGFIFALSLLIPVPAVLQAKDFVDHWQKPKETRYNNICGSLNKIIGTNGKQPAVLATFCKNKNAGLVVRNAYTSTNTLD